MSSWLTPSCFFSLSLADILSSGWFIVYTWFCPRYESMKGPLGYISFRMFFSQLWRPIFLSECFSRNSGLYFFENVFLVNGLRTICHLCFFLSTHLSLVLVMKLDWLCRLGFTFYMSEYLVRFGFTILDMTKFHTKLCHQTLLALVISLGGYKIPYN